MTVPAKIECQVHFPRGKRQVLDLGPGPSLPPGRVPRIARLLALALRLDQLLKTSVLADQRQLAELGQVSRARVSQILSLLYLAPDIQEAILFLPHTVRGRDPVHLAQLQPLAQTLDWREQRRLWQQLYPLGTNAASGSMPGSARVHCGRCRPVVSVTDKDSCPS